VSKPELHGIAARPLNPKRWTPFNSCFAHGLPRRMRICSTRCGATFDAQRPDRRRPHADGEGQWPASWLQRGFLRRMRSGEIRSTTSPRRATSCGCGEQASPFGDRHEAPRGTPKARRASEWLLRFGSATSLEETGRSPRWSAQGGSGSFQPHGITVDVGSTGLLWYASISSHFQHPLLAVRRQFVEPRRPHAGRVGRTLSSCGTSAG
jgi:hypothetical protein